jgi:hypothetical protein
MCNWSVLWLGLRLVLAIVVLLVSGGCSNSQYERLADPRVVDSVSDSGLVLFGDGTRMEVPALAALQDQPAVREMLLRNGVEVDQDGRVWVLIDVLARCGNDPDGDRRKRVALNPVLKFLADPSVKFEHADLPTGVDQDGFSVVSWLQYEKWLRSNR